MLKVERVSKHFGGVYANRDVSLEVAEGELRGVIGPNGAGKSTLFNLIAGHLRPDSGSISLAGTRIDRLPPHVRSRRGVAIVFQGARLFAGMSLLQNVMVGAHARSRAGLVSAALRPPAQRREEREIRAQAEQCLDRVGLLELADRPADGLPLGQQRRLQVARALAGRPRLLLLDEPASGLRAAERTQLADLVRELNAARHDHPARRARRRHGHLAGSAHHGAGPRRGDRRRLPGGGHLRPRRPQGLPRNRSRACCTSVTSSCATARRSPSTGCPSRSAEARWSPWSDPTGPASPR